MNAVLGITEIQLQKDSMPNEIKDAFTRIYNSSKMLLKLINDILDLSKVEAGKMEIIPNVYDTASMIVDTVHLNIMYIGSKQIQFKLDVDENLPTHHVGDELRIKQVINNILSNAFKYTPQGEVTLSFSTTPTHEDDTVIMEITVSDTGEGMTKEQVENLQSDFLRFNLEYNRHIEGSGLGLGIAFQLAQMMNGSITVDSAPGEGTTFTIRLPQKLDGDGVLGTEAAANLKNLKNPHNYIKHLLKLEREPMPYGRVLVVDDVDTNLYVAEGMFMPYKLVVETVDSGLDAIKKVKDGEVYDIIFMDHMMPIMDGIEATRIIRELGYDYPVIALTANAFRDMADMYKNNRFTDYASKPIDIDQMDKLLLKYIRDKQPPEVIARAREGITG
jgi:CheY-like chemotaxis protein